MSYNDFWFIETRVQTRNLRRWLIWFILLFIFVTIGSILAVKTMYKDIKVYPNQVADLKIEVSEAKATNVNGYIKGDVTNQGNEKINGKYLCFALCNKANEIVDTEYIELENLEVGQTKTYELKFKDNNIFSVYILVTDSKNK